MLFLLFRLDERSRKVVLVLCALFILVLLIFGGIYVAIEKFMKKQALKMDTYMYDLIKFKLVRNKNHFKSAVFYHEQRILFNTSKWFFRILILFTGIACILTALVFDKNFSRFFSEFFKLIPNFHWTTIKETNESLSHLENYQPIIGPGWLPVSVIPNVSLNPNLNFDEPILYCSTVYYIVAIACFVGLTRSTIAFIARVHRAFKMSNDVFQKDLSTLSPDDLSEFSNMINSPLPNINNNAGNNNNNDNSNQDNKDN